MRDTPAPKRVEDAPRAIQAAGRFCRAVFYEERGTGSVDLHVPDRVLGHRKYHDLQVSGAVLKRIEERLERGEPCDDLGDLISLELPRRKRVNLSRKRYSPKSSF